MAGKQEKKLGTKVILYCRVSTLGQLVEGESLEAQEAKLRVYANEHKLEVVGVFKDSCSGAIHPRERPQMKICMAMLEAGNIQGIVVTKLDRLSRSIKDFVNLMEEFKRKEWSFFAIYPDVNSDTPQGKFMMNLLMIIAELERDMTSERVKDVLALKREKGEVAGTIPFGKKQCPITKLVIDDEEERRTIRLATDRRNIMCRNKRGKTVQTTYKQVADYLVEMGRPNREGLVKWHPSQVRNFVIRN